MKKSSNTNGSYSGIKIADNISLSLPGRKYLADCIPIILIALSGCIGTVNSFMTMFKIDISLLTINLYTVFLSLVFSLLFINKRSISTPVIPLILVYEFFLYRKWDNYLNGMTIVCNQVYNVIYPDRGDYFRVEFTKDPVLDTKIFIFSTIFLLVLIICCLSVVWPDFFFGFLFTFPIVEIGLYHGKTPALLPAFILIIYWTSLLALNKSGYYRSSKRNKTGFIRKENTFSSKPSIRIHSAGRSGITMLIVSAILITGAFTVTGLSGYSRSDKLNTMRYNVKTAVSEFSFDDLAGSLERLSASFGLGSIKSYDHRLGNNSSLSFSGRTDLTVTAGISNTPDNNIYLKSYVGSVYDGKSWDELDDDIYDKNRNILNDLENNGHHPQNMLYENFGKDMSAIYGDYYITVQSTIFSEKYSYIPYSSLPDAPVNEVDYIDDTVIDLKNKKKYSFAVSPFQSFNDLFNTPYSGNVNEYDAYGDFVRKNYLDVPNNDDTRKLYDKFIENNIYSSTYNQLKYIKKLLAENASYTLEPGKTPTGRDFVSYFLLENHKGYCVHFATAGIILARMSGIPARYAEGYVLLKDQLNEKNIKNDKYQVEIQDSAAHAWAEIYIDGYGWIPYEFTPGSAAALTPSENSGNVQLPEITLQPPTLNNTQQSRNTTTTAASTKTTIKTKENTGFHTNNKGNDFSLSKFISELSFEVKLTVTIVFLLIVFMASIAVIHHIVIKKREKSFNTGSNSKNAINAYNYIVKLLEFCEIKNENMQYLEFAEFAELHKMRIFKSGELTEITKIVLEAALSGHDDISREQADKAVLLSYKTALSVFRKQSVFGRFYMKFIRNLC